MAASKSSSSSQPSTSAFDATFPPLPPRPPPSKPPDPPPSHGNPSSSKGAPSNFNSSNTSKASVPSFVKSDYASLFRSSPRNAGSYKPIQFDIVRDGKKKPIPDLVRQEGINYWNNFLIGFFLDGTLSFQAVANYLHSRWKLVGEVDIKSDGCHFYFKFSNDSDREKILRSDPIFIRGRMFIITVWDPSIGCAQSQIHKVPVWIHLYRIPMILWTLIGINWLVNHIGRLICYDTSTERLNRFRYAKALVEVSSEYELPDSIEVDGLGEHSPIVKVSYDWKPKICVNCKLFGHDTMYCELHSDNQVEDVNKVKVDLKNFQDKEEVQFQKQNQNTNAAANFDKWTNVYNRKQKYWRRKNVVSDQSNENKDANVGTDNVNPFENLNSVDMDNIVDDIDGQVPNEASDPIGDDVFTNAEAYEDKDTNVGIEEDGDFGNLFYETSQQSDCAHETSGHTTRAYSTSLSFTNTSSCTGLSASVNVAALSSSATTTMSCSSSFSHSTSALASSTLKVSSAQSGASISSEKQSPYAHLKPPDHLVLPPSMIDPAILSNAVPTSAHPSSKSKGKLKGKFWDNADLDEGIDYNVDDVLPAGSSVKSKKRHTRRNPSPLFDPFFT